MMFGHYFATDTYDMKFNLGRDCEARFGQDFMLTFCRNADIWLRL